MCSKTNEMASNNNVWLVGETISGLDRETLPRCLDVLKLFFHHQRIGKETIEHSAKKSAEEVANIWSATKIQTLLLRNITLKIVKLKDNYEAIKKSRFRKTDTQIQKEAEFIESLNKLFDISSKTEQSISKEQEQFLVDQRGCRQLKISLLKPLASPLVLPTSPETSSSESESNENESEASDFEDSLLEWDSDDSNTRAIKTQMLQTIVDSTEMTSALDRTNTSDGKYTILTSSMARACNVDINRLNLSHSTISRKRKHNRNILVDDIKQDFFSLLEEDTFGLVIHFDGKMLPNSTAEDSSERNSKVDRIGVVVKGLKFEKLLGVVKANNGEGATIAAEVDRVLSEWDNWNKTYGKNKAINIRDRIIGMVFDTTASNTGHLNGACKIFEERYMKRKLLHFACRHHIYEIVVGGVFKELFGETDGPNVGIFQRFRAVWKNINKKKFKVAKFDFVYTIIF